MNLVCVCVCARGQEQEGQESEWGTEEWGVSTHTNEGDKLLIGVFIRAVGRERKALQLVGDTLWRGGDRSFSYFTVASRESRHYMTLSTTSQDGTRSHRWRPKILFCMLHHV